VREGDLTSYRILLQVWFLLIINFEIKIEDSNYKIKINIEIKLVTAVIRSSVFIFSVINLI
jgi:hypothetical protein